MDWDEKRRHAVARNLVDLEEIKLMMHGLPRNADGFAELERRIARKQNDLRALLASWGDLSQAIHIARGGDAPTPKQTI